MKYVEFIERYDSLTMSTNIEYFMNRTYLKFFLLRLILNMLANFFYRGNRGKLAKLK